MQILISILTITLCFFLSLTCLDASKVETSRILRRKREAESNLEVRKVLRKSRIIAISVMITLCSAITMWQLCMHATDLLNVIKLSIALICLVGGACVDYIEHRIPNFFSASMAMGAVILLLCGLILEQNGAIAYIVSGVFSSAITTACLVVASLLSHSGIGAGDIKLTAALGLIGGVYVLCGTLLSAMILCSIAVCILLISKRKTIKQSVPFGPFLLLGYMFTICIMQF